MSEVIKEDGIVSGMSEELYHSDPTPAIEGFAQSASFSSSMACALVEKTEEEAMLDSRRLNSAYQERSSDAMDFGTIAHDYVLRGGVGTFEIAPFDAWRSNDAKAAKAEIESRGLIALNESTRGILDTVKTMKQRLHEQLDGHRDFAGLMTRGRGEQSAFAYDGTIWNRARFDWLDNDYQDLVVDYKTTGIDFDKWQNGQLWSEGKYMQAPHYRKVHDLITGNKSRFVFVVQQNKAPFHVRVFELDRSFDEDIGNRYAMARKRFINCLKTGIWRGQPPYTTHSCPPPWVLTKWEIDEGDIRV